MEYSYPPTEAGADVDTLAGLQFSDPYRWLEGAGPQVRSWQRAQADFTHDVVAGYPGLAGVRELVERYQHPSRKPLPYFAAGDWFFIDSGGDSEHTQVVMSSEPYRPGVVLFDTRSQPAGSVVSWIAPAPDGRTLAVGVCTDGSERNIIQLVDTRSRVVLADAPTQVLMDNWLGGVQWLPDSSGFFFSALIGSAEEFRQGVFLHLRGNGRDELPRTTQQDVSWPRAAEYRLALVSDDGRHAVALDRDMTPTPVAVATRRGAEWHWRPFVMDSPAMLAGRIIGDRYIAVTDVEAPRGRIVAIELDSATPGDPSTWDELLPESEAVLRGVTPVGDVLYVTEMVDTYSRVSIITLDGKRVGQVDLPGNGALSDHPFAIGVLANRPRRDEFIFGFSTLTCSVGIYRHRPGMVGVETLVEPAVRLDGVQVSDHWAYSADGTRVPYHVVSSQGIPAGETHPTLIYAYGGYNAPHPPAFPSAMAAFVGCGGSFVHAHIRGGNEFGRDWWESARYETKQHSYDDLIAIAEQLVTDGVTTPGQLAVIGASNGGLLTTAVITQRPDLFGAAVALVPMVDLIGACRDPYGRWAMALDFGNPDLAQDVARIARLSPYLQIRDGLEYPALYIQAGDSDPRCLPFHARKLAARMQAAQAGTKPILLRVWEGAGHGWATNARLTAELTTEYLAFLFQQLGMSVHDGDKSSRDKSSRDKSSRDKSISDSLAYE